MTLNAAFLVDVDETAGFQAMIRRLQDLNDGVELVATGPWPPYSFAMLEQTMTQPPSHGVSTLESPGGPDGAGGPGRSTAGRRRGPGR